MTRARATTVPTALEGHLRLQGGCGGGCRACDSIWRYVSLRLGPIGAGAGQPRQTAEQGVGRVTQRNRQLS